MNIFHRLALAAGLLLATLSPAFAVDLSITAANVVPGADAVTQQGLSGATITAGQTVYLDSTTSTYKLCDADASLAASNCVGIALNAASANQPIVVQTKGSITIGATVVNGTTYYSSTGAGGITATVPTTAGFPLIVGIAKSTTVLVLDFTHTGVVI
jgi:hypothetical protein